MSGKGGASGGRDGSDARRGATDLQGDGRAADPMLVARLLTHLVDLCGTASPSRNEREVADKLRGEFEALGMTVREDDAGSSTGGNAGNLIAELPGGLPERVVLAAHMDTVPLAQGEPLAPIVEGTVVRTTGRQILGADDKAGVCVVLELAARAAATPFAERPTVVAVVTVCEELGLLGAKHLDVAALRADHGYSFDGEVPVGELVTAAVFKEDVTFMVEGRAAHAALEPERGVHAIKAAAAVVAAIPLGRVADDQVLNIGAIQGGGSTNVIPALVSMRGEFRSFTAERLEELAERVLRLAQAAATEHGARLSVERKRLYAGYSLPDDAVPVGRLAETAAANGIEARTVSSIGGSDTSIFNQKGLPTVNVGVNMHEIHSVNEWIDAADLARVVAWVSAAMGLRGVHLAGPGS
ncbi:MAG: M20/M25/M40 family metallo-hydrolase [Trueperaceae bacterium]|nr:M20/M25/M40 family metallo-hydrolase [Trueperaceae bacterium]